MTQLGTRSASQVLRTFLPQQTADLGGGIYRVTEWSGANPLTVDDSSLRRRLVRELYRWESEGRDAGFADDLRNGRRLEVVEVDETRGVAVERYPRVWLCPTCKRIGKDPARSCRCGNKRWGQLQFLGFHECGYVGEPWIKRCPSHDDVALRSPKSSRLEDLRFQCPTCQFETQKGLGYRRCDGCQQGALHWNVHKARSAYTPHGAVLVNPPRPDRLQALLAAGGARRALAWVVEGMTSTSPQTMTSKPTRGTFVDSLVRSGLSTPLAETLADQAAAAGELAPEDDLGGLDLLAADRRDAAEQEALDVALALAEARVPSTALAAPPGSALGEVYAHAYPTALHRAGLAAIDLVEQFPVLNVVYGYTRGAENDARRLVPFRHPRREGYRLHGDLSETEAYLVRLDPLRVADWLTRHRGHALPGYQPSAADPTAARLAVLAAAAVPRPGDPLPDHTVGSDLALLVHSYAHRMLRQTAVLAGIDRDSLNEYLVPLHLGFFLYASPRGEFVLGGLQALFETDLDVLLDAVSDAEHRCPLDPGCSRGSGACSACLHLGETSCRSYNTYLDRRSLFGPAGYLTATPPGPHPPAPGATT